MKEGVEIFESLHYKIQMFRVLIDGSSNVFCNNKSVFKNTITLESVLNKNHHYISYHRCRE